MSDSVKPILFAGGIASVALLAGGWMYAASSSHNAEREAIAHYEALVARDKQRLAPSTEAAQPEAEEAKVEEAEAVEEEPKVAEAEEPKTEEPVETAAAEPETAAEEPKSEESAEEAETEEPAAETEVVAAPASAEEEPAEEAATEEPAAETEVAAAPASAEEEPAEEAATEEPAAETEVAAASTTAVEEPAEETAVAVVASVGGDAAKGKKVFRKCKACHQVGDGAKNKVGPPLNGIIGRAVGSLDNFDYSKVFQDANAAGQVWSVETLAEFLEKPRNTMKGTKMAFGGLRKEDDRANVLAYLSEFQ